MLTVVCSLVSCGTPPVPQPPPATVESTDLPAPDRVIISLLVQSARERGWVFDIIDGHGGWLTAVAEISDRPTGFPRRIRWYFAVDNQTLTVRWRVDELRAGAWQQVENAQQNGYANYARREIEHVSKLIKSRYSGPPY